jgi:hypothetical protein
MRKPVDAKRVEALARLLSATVREDTTLYLTGGSTAVMKGWRASTVDVDLLIEPESDEVLRRIATAKEELDVNIELSKIERGFEQDLADVTEMVSRGMVDPGRALELFAEIEPELFRYPAIDPAAFRRKVERALS